MLQFLHKISGFVNKWAPFKAIMLLEYLKYKLSEQEPDKPVSDEDIALKNGIMHHIKRVAFEISNTCNYTNIHDRCPVSCYIKSVTLSKAVVHKTIDELAEYDYDGFISFHRYNEPMINKKKLFDYIEYVNEKLPNAKVSLLTNGSYLFEEEMKKLEDLKVAQLMVSAYSKQEFKRLNNLKTNLDYTVFYSFLDFRQSIYDREPVDLQKPCYATIRDITINCFGHISLCCYDWNNQETFGSLHDQTLSEILNSDRFQQTHQNLTQGHRKLDICRRCKTCR